MAPLKIGFESEILEGPATGVANYCFQLIHALLDHRSGAELVGFSGLSWKPFDAASFAALARSKEEDLSAPSPTHQRSGALRASLSRITFARRLYRSLKRQRFLITSRNTRLDLFHAFKYVPPATLEIPVLPVVYDLSFVRHPEMHPRERLKYLEPLPDLIAKAPLVHTISEFSKREIADIFRYPPDRIVVALPAASENFRPLGDEATANDIAKFNLVLRGYLMFVGTLEPRKNLKTAILAYAQLPAARRMAMPLIVVGGHGWGDVGLPSVTDRLVREGSVRVLGAVSNRYLRSLYEGARALVFPSLYEGFGMPVVEAMACGALVAHSSESAMDEITDSLGLRAPATDIDAWAAIIRQLSEQPEAGDAARASRIARANSFSWERSAQIVDAVYSRFAH